jgi:hypothetical protein
VTYEGSPRNAAMLGGDAARIDALCAAGIESPLKLDLISSLYETSGFISTESLAEMCGASQRDAASALEALVRDGRAVCRRFYKIAEYAAAEDEVLAHRLRSLIGEGPAEVRRLRRGLLIRQHLGSPAPTRKVAATVPR